MNNSKRIISLAKYSLGYDSLVDVGADHGYLGIMAYYVYGVKKILLTDVSKNALQAAKDNLRSNGLLGRIKLAVGDGLKPIDDDYEVLNISGMGGQLAVEILNSDLEKAKKFKRIILGPNRDSYAVRKFLNANNFVITNEEIVYDHKFYEIIVCEPSESEVKKLTDEELKFGPINLEEKSENFISLYSLRKKALEESLANCSENGRVEVEKKIKELNAVLKKKK